MREQVADLPGGLDPGERGHPHVHEHDVGDQVLGLLDGLLAIGGLTHEFDVGLLLEDHLQAATEQGVVVDDHHTELLSGLAARVRVLGRHRSPSLVPRSLLRIGSSRAQVSGF